MHYGDIIFLVIITVYLGIRLFSVLGKKQEGEDAIGTKRSFTMPEEGIEKSREVNPESSVVVQMKEVDHQQMREEEVEDYKYTDDSARNGVVDIISSDKTFILSEFVEGAKSAFEMIFKAYSEQDKDTLKNILSSDPYNMLDEYLTKIEADNLTDIKSLVSIEEKEIKVAMLEGNVAIISVTFKTEQINFTKNEDGEVVDGDETYIDEIEDTWTFERNIRSTNPNWKITSI